MLPTELWIIIAQYMKNKELYYLSLCSKDTYSSTQHILKIRRLIVKFVNRCALSHLTYRRYSAPKQYLPTAICISEYQTSRLSSYPCWPPPHPWYVNRYVKQQWELYFIPWQLGSRHDRNVYLESHPECVETFEDEFNSFLEKNKLNQENRIHGLPINKSYPYCQKAEPGVTEKEGYIKQYRHPAHTVCYKCHLIGSYLDIDEAVTSYGVSKNGKYIPKLEPMAICSDCIEAEHQNWEPHDDYEEDLFD